MESDIEFNKEDFDINVEFAKCYCGNLNILPENVWFDESGYGYSTKLTKCSRCGRILVLGHIEDYGLNINFDERYYE